MERSRASDSAPPQGRRLRAAALGLMAVPLVAVGAGDPDPAERPAGGELDARAKADRGEQPSTLQSATRALSSAPRLRPPNQFHDPPHGARRFRGTGRLLTVAGSSKRSAAGRLRRYIVEVEEGLPVNPRAFATEVERTLADRRGWGGRNGFSLRRVDSRPARFRIVLASPQATDRLCAPHDTRGRLSCYRGGKAVLNVWRWSEGADSYDSDLRGYRRYLVNHEVGHALGHGEHRTCSGAGDRAPVMMQQTVTASPCKPHAWPLPSERAAIAP